MACREDPNPEIEAQPHDSGHTAPAVDFVLRDTGFTAARLGLSPKELERYGPSVVIDENRADGDKLIVWTQ